MSEQEARITSEEIDRQLCACGHQRKMHDHSGRCRRGAGTGERCPCPFFRFTNAADVEAWIAFDPDVPEAT